MDQRRPQPDLESCDTTTARYRIHARVALGGGGDDPILLVHGLGMAGETMLPLARCFARDFNVLAPDQPGFGASPGPERPLGLAEIGDALAEWLDAVSIDRVAAVGASIGSQIAAELAARHPERVSAVVLASPTFDAEAATAGWQLLRWMRNARHEQGSLGAVIHHCRRAGVGRVVATFRAALRHELIELLPRVQAPTLVVRGAIDPVVPQAWAERVAALVPRGTLQVLPGQSHSLDNRVADDLADAIRSFLPRSWAEGRRA